MAFKDSAQGGRSRRALKACAQAVRSRRALKTRAQGMRSRRALMEGDQELTSLTLSCFCKSSIMDSSRAEVLILRCLTRLLMFSSIKDEGSGGGGPGGHSG